MTRIGQFDRVIEIKRSEETVTDSGGVTSTWSTVSSLRTMVVKKLSDEILEAYGEADNSKITLRTRYTGDISLKDQIVLDGIEYNIREIIEIGRRRGLEIHCEVIQ